MTIFNLYIFNRYGECIHYKQWNRDKEGGISQQEEFKLMYGMLLSLRSFTKKLSPTDGDQCLKSYNTNGYKLNYIETGTGWKMVLNTDIHAQGIQQLMRQIYSQAVVGIVIKNPLVDSSKKIESQLFVTTVDSIVEKHPAFV